MTSNGVPSRRQTGGARGGDGRRLVKIFHEKSGISKTCSPWLVHGMFLLCQYEGWPKVCQEIFEDHTRLGHGATTRKISSEAMRALVPGQWVSLVDVYLDSLSAQDISQIFKRDEAIRVFSDSILESSLSAEESAARVQNDPETLRTVIKMYLAIYLPGEISDYVNATTAQKSHSVSSTTLKAMGRRALSYVDSPDTPEAPSVETLCLIMTAMMRRVGVLR